MSSRAELERWTCQVRIDTRNELNHLHHRQADVAHSEASTIEQRVWRWVVDMRQAARQGWPAVERLIVRLINPKVTAEHLLPDASLHR